jgi:preprotein translocase subunit SecG
MTNIILVVHILIALGLMGVVLLQRSEGGGLGIGGGAGGGGMGNLFTGRGTANFLTRTTMVLAAGFFATSVLLAVLAGGVGSSRSVLDQVPAAATEEPAAPAAAPESEEPSVPIR